MSTARATSLLATARKWRPALFRQPEVAAAADAPPRSLASALAETFEDGTTSGARTAAQYRRLCATVGRIIETDHHALAVRLQEAYRRHDPSAAPDAARRRRAAPEFSALLHAVARRAGFALCTAAHEDRASAEHFGPDMWNVPVATRWEEIDGSLVDARRGGFDAYAAEGAEAGRPTFAGKLLLYHRGEGEARKVGYFTAEKAEELLWRFCASVTAPLVRPAAARIERAYSAAEDGVRRARRIVQQHIDRPNFNTYLASLGLSSLALREVLEFDILDTRRKLRGLTGANLPDFLSRLLHVCLVCMGAAAFGQF